MWTLAWPCLPVLEVLKWWIIQEVRIPNCSPHFDDLAWTALDHDVLVLADSRTLLGICGRRTRVSGGKLVIVVVIGHICSVLPECEN